MYSESKSLKEIIRKLENYAQIKDRNSLPKQFNFNKIETDSRRVSECDVFVCISGFQTDGHLFANAAIKNGAKLLIVEKILEYSIPQIVVKNTRKSTAILANLFFEDPTSKFKLIGITGTNGKTTTANIIYQMLLKLGNQVGLIGTFGYSISGENFSSKRTTPDIIDLNIIFQKMISNNVEFVIMEVSSHSIALQRVFSLSFNAAIFTNLTQDHLNFHKNINEYAETKFKLFDYVTQNKGISIINIDDSFGKKLFNKLEGSKFSFSVNKSDYQITEIDNSIQKNNFSIIHNNISTELVTNLIGKFNIYNLVAAFSLLDQLNISINKIVDLSKKISLIPGRLQKIDNNKNIDVFVDYAHTPDALDNVLSTLSKLKKKRIITVFGAGGDRDKTKRPEMLKAVLKHSDLVIITNDNPRFEKPESIIHDIVLGADKTSNIWVMRDRRIAIEIAINLAHEEDILLIAGKGHETYQEICGERFDFSDIEIATKALEKSNQYNKFAIPFEPMTLEYLLDVHLNSYNFELLKEVSTDSRDIKKNTLFIALKGDNFDGHDYVEEILNIGCWAIVNDNCPIVHKNIIKVPDTLIAYGHIANHYKKLFAIVSIGITGTYGKTTVKEYLSNILEHGAPVLKTFANENNLIGLPKTIFKLRPEHKYGVFELGSNHFGEIAKLTKILQPDIGVITAIGPSHLEFLRDEEGVYQEKSALFRSDMKLRFFPGKEKKFSEFKGKTFGYNKKFDYNISDITHNDDSTDFKVNSETYSIPTPFTKYTLNACIAIAICSELGIDKRLIRQGIEKPLDISARMEIVKSGERSLIIDCYNANPDSMKAAINFWKNFHPEKPHIAVLGDMLELGELTKFYHKKIWEQLNSINNIKVISVGEQAKQFEADQHYDTVENLILSNILESFHKNSVILIKASHGIKLEKIIGRL